MIFDWPGKSPQTENGIEHPAIYHMLDVAAVAEQLLARHHLPSGLHHAFALLIALHDLGKINESFRRMLRGDSPPTYRHWEVSEYLLSQNDDFFGPPLGSANLCRSLWPQNNSGRRSSKISVYNRKLYLLTN